MTPQERAGHWERLAQFAAEYSRANVSFSERVEWLKLMKAEWDAAERETEARVWREAATLLKPAVSWGNVDDVIDECERRATEAEQG